MSSPASLRLATEADIPALLSLLLTSFRQFPLFSFLYSPLNTNKDAAHDTIFFWGRRILLDLLDPAAKVLLAEIDSTLHTTKSRLGERSSDAVEDESWRMLEWVESKGKLSQVSLVNPGKMIVGFAIWKERAGEKGENRSEPKKSWPATLRTTATNAELYFWKKVYQRKDQNLDAYEVYLAAEEELSAKYYAESCYYLDNLCVDFRCQRLGIGTILAEWGLAQACSKGLPAQTEAGPMGIGVYLKLGFEQIGTWKVPTANGEQAYMELPVMKLEVA